MGRSPQLPDSYWVVVAVFAHQWLLLGMEILKDPSVNLEFYTPSSLLPSSCSNSLFCPLVQWKHVPKVASSQHSVSRSVESLSPLMDVFPFPKNNTVKAGSTVLLLLGPWMWERPHLLPLDTWLLNCNSCTHSTINCSLIQCIFHILEVGKQGKVLYCSLSIASRKPQIWPLAFSQLGLLHLIEHFQSGYTQIPALQRLQKKWKGERSYLFGLLWFSLSHWLKLTSLGINTCRCLGCIIHSFDGYIIISSIVLLVCYYGHYY